MNKFAILTFHDTRNYGAILQAFALQTIIQNLGYEVEILRYYDKNYIGASKYSYSFSEVFKLLKVNKFKILTYIKTYSKKNSATDKFEFFRRIYFKNSHDAYYDYDDLEKANKDYHGFICGSDMIWSDIGQDLDIYFLNFADSKKRISYAPSITGTTNYSKDKNLKMYERINRIRFLSCREQSGIDYIKTLSGRIAELVLDPTFLLKKNDWINNLDLKEYKN
jgi:hypothetical protein